MTSELTTAKAAHDELTASILRRKSKHPIPQPYGDDVAAAYKSGDISDEATMLYMIADLLARIDAEKNKEIAIETIGYGGPCRKNVDQKGTRDD